MNMFKQKIAIKEWLKYFPILLLIFLFSFAPKPKTKRPRIVNLPDSCFAYRNFSSTLTLREFSREPFEQYHRDSDKEIKLYSIDNNQKKRIIPQITCIKTHIDTSFVACCTYGFLLAKEVNIGTLTPIIFHIGGDDYSELIYVLLDKNDNPISHFSLAGGLEAGPIIETDSLWVLPPFKASHIKGNIILSYVLHCQWRRDDSLIYDSVSYKTVVSQNGEIKTSRIDSEHYERMPHNSWNPFGPDPNFQKKSLK